MPQVITDEYKQSNPDIEKHTEVAWPPILSCDLFSVGLQLLFFVVLPQVCLSENPFFTGPYKSEGVFERFRGLYLDGPGCASRWAVCCDTCDEMVHSSAREVPG